ncbi:taste receptor type 2 member 106-like [Polyodon spathula]|uniref:taste receptor type 2 member 106-like n=1 Tax=Polyodon spathula TaxID=7913 RepID=UPI001B7DE8E1|nr:taste receptor type 2 member 106-like [Polyodon spathula]
MTPVVLGELVGDGLLACLGVAGNTFILSSNAWHFWSGAREKPGHLLAGEMTISCIAVANLLMNLIGFLWFVIKTFHLECLFGNVAYKCIIYSLIVTGACSFWFTNCLCVFYLVKIINVPNAFFIRLKRNISVLTSTFLVITFTFIPTILSFQFHQTNISEANGNVSESACNVYMTNYIPTGIQILSGVLLLYLPAGSMAYVCVRIVVYLHHHIKRMKRSSYSETPLSSSLQAQIRISRMITCLVIVYLLCDTVLFLVLLGRLFFMQQQFDSHLRGFCYFCFHRGHSLHNNF